MHKTVVWLGNRWGGINAENKVFWGPGTERGYFALFCHQVRPLHCICFLIVHCSCALMLCIVRVRCSCCIVHCSCALMQAVM